SLKTCEGRLEHGSILNGNITPRRVSSQWQSTVARRSTEMVRLADGKQLLNKMRSHYNNTGRWEGHLTKTVTKGQFAVDFRALLLEKTGANA
ncbi:hypothetical protein, partial [Rhizobium sp. UGM030330-04]|uniref:hypothetical protein n=1 Tax=Rhizobium sp. UGM030330-04 TaxID=1378077 RepID=UPI001AECA375